MKYEFITVRQLATAINLAPFDTNFDFAFDTKESIEVNGEPTGWYGAKITTIFDEYDGVLCMGYWGGYCTKCVDMYMASDNVFNLDDCVDAVEREFVEWTKILTDTIVNNTICVEVTDQNRKYIYEAIGNVKE